jgi:UDP-N-acetylglucosamine--N-acetylmuramyl-(pentapeptide) pyrophosphoryl-undecaprenol N-acetylglucosamine transferase
VPGLTNRILGRFVDRIFLTFADTEGFFPRGKTIVTGNPVRTAFLSGEKSSREQGGPFTILIFGGSQGAGAINRTAIDALAGLAHLRDNIRFIHQTGEHDRQTVEEAYQKKGFTAEVHPFILEMAAACNRADLLLCRAGATSIAEITAMGKASVLIPLPTAAGDHQTKNALLLAKAGAAAMIPEKELDGPKLASVIEELYRHPETVRKMEFASASLGRKDAAAAITDIIYQGL